VCEVVYNAVTFICLFSCGWNGAGASLGCVEAVQNCVTWMPGAPSAL